MTFKIGDVVECVTKFHNLHAFPQKGRRYVVIDTIIDLPDFAPGQLVKVTGKIFKTDRWIHSHCFRRVRKEKWT